MTKRLNAARRRQKPGRAPRGVRGSRARLSAVPAEAKEIEVLRSQLRQVARQHTPPRWNANPEDARRSVVKLVLTLIDLIRQLLERQAIRRMENGTLTSDETEAIGLALMRLEETIRELAAQFEIPLEELNLDLGPIGRLV